MRTPVTYYGGKQHLVKELLPLIPSHGLYVEAFAGGGALFFAKVPSPAEVLNDLNGEICNFYAVCKISFHDLKQKIDSTLHSRASYKLALSIYNNPKDHDAITRAWSFWVLTNQGFSGKIGSWALGNTNKIGKTLSNKREGFNPSYAERLKYTQIENNDALKVIRQYDSEETFFYLDPPYFNSDCGHYSGYSENDFKSLLKTLTGIKGKFILSNYPSVLLEHFIQDQGWNSLKKEQKVSVSHKSKKMKTEMIVFNYQNDFNFLNKKINTEDCRLILEKYGENYKKKEIKTLETLFEKVDELFKN